MKLEEYKNTLRGQVLCIAIPNVQVHMCGVTYFTINKRRLVTLHYTDGSKESAKLSHKFIVETDNVFSFVERVQEKARKA